MASDAVTTAATGAAQASTLATPATAPADFWRARCLNAEAHIERLRTERNHTRAVLQRCRQQLDDLLASVQAAKAAGWRLVPPQPTPQMATGFRRAFLRPGAARSTYPQRLAAGWAGAVAAAPAFAAPDPAAAKTVKAGEPPVLDQVLTTPLRVVTREEMGLGCG